MLLAVGDGRSTWSVVSVDPVTLVVAALAAGASAGATDAAAQGVKDAYAALKSLVARKAAGRPDEFAVEEHAADPKAYEAPVAKLVKESGAAADAEVLAAARRLLELADPKGAAAGTYTITASGKRAVAAHTIHGNVSTGDTK
jgi:hypothetical protein